MSDRHNELRELLPLYALGALEEPERREVEAALDRDPALEAELARWVDQVEVLAETVAPVTPAETSRARLLASLPARASSSRSGGWMGWAAAAVLAVTAGWLAWGNAELRSRLESTLAERDAEATRATRLASDLATAREELQRLVLAHNIVAAPGARGIRLAGLGDVPGAAAHTYVDPSTRKAVFYASELPPAPADRTYQLWFIADGKPVSAGVFEVDERGDATLLVDDVAPVDSIQAWAVTVEPEGGVAQPTGAVVLKG
ncbi:MAG: anti-sigma factor [Thermoanaerobaculia bacterium]